MEAEQFSALYESLSKQMFAFAAQRLSPQEAADVVSDTFEVVWRKRDKAPQEAAEWPQWCFGIARNKVLQASQRPGRKHHDSRFAEDYVAAGIEPPPTRDVATTVVESAHAHMVWQSLTASERELATLILTTEASASEVTAMLGTSYSAYTTRVSRLRQKLSRLMGPDQNLREGEAS